MSTGILFEPSPAIFSWVEWGDDLKSMWEKLQDFDLEFQVKACDVASLSNVQDDPLLEGLVQDATSRYDIMVPMFIRRMLQFQGSSTCHEAP